MKNVGIIGLGNMGKLHLLNALRIDDVRVVAAADKSEFNRKSVKKYHVKTYDDYTKMLDAEKLDAVIVSLPNFLKKDCVFYTAEKKVNIFLEKPMALNYDEAQEMVQKVEKENVRMTVGVNYRYYPCVQKLKNSFDDGRIGDAVIATSDLILSGPMSHGAVPAPVPEWWLSKETAGGGALIDLGYHLIDIFSWMFGDLDIVYSNLGYRFNLPVEDSATVVLKSRAQGVTCVVNVGWFSKSVFPDFNFRVNIHGTAGYDSTDKYSPRDLRVNAVKQGMQNILRRIVFKKTNYLSYTYYYSSYYEILRLFFEALHRETEFSIPLKKELDVIRLIDTVYNQHSGE
jgi:myo-inositol 2-dehydrogenase / D-chiro-inositol 1-dehydrogenase